MSTVSINKPLISTDVFVVPYENAYIIYAPLRRLAFVANAAAVNMIALLKEGAIENPTEEQSTFIRFLDAIHLTGADGNRPIGGLVQPTYKPTEVTLFLTSLCNLRCVYCYAQAGELPAVRMPLEIAKRGIDYVVANALELKMGRFGVNYHGGGEPTINHTVLIDSHAYAKDLAKLQGLRLSSGIATNGVISPRIRQWIIENLQGASVSLDGPPEVHDRNRPMVSGAGSGVRVLETLQAFDEAGFRYGIRMTVSSKTVNEMANSVRFILDHFKPSRLQIEPVYALGRGMQTDLHVDVDAFIRGYRESWEIAHEQGIELIFSSARIDAITSRFCRAYGEGFSLTPKGNVSGCFEVYDESADFAEDVIFGTYDEKQSSYIFDEAKLEKLREHNVGKQTWCNGCFAKWHCSGDCANKARHASIDGEFQGMPSCDITRSIILHQIVRKISDSGGTIWMEQGLSGT